MVGENNPAWKGADTKVKGMYLTVKWFNLKWKVKKRDNFECQNDGCKSKDGLTIHHKIKAIERPDLFYDENNLITYCRSCHLKIEPRRRRNG